MSQRRQLAERLASLGESGEIIRSMKNLAFMETRKLARLIEHQRGVVAQLDGVARDFLAFFPETLPPSASLHQVFLVIGSRRGFCGDFNERLVSRLAAEQSRRGANQAPVLGVGHKLCRRLQSVPALTTPIEGADVAEEIPAVLRAIVDELDAQRARHGALSMSVLYQSAETQQPQVVRMLPPFEQHRGAVPRHADAPLLNLGPRRFLLELGEQYLFAALHGVLFESLLAENERRVRHLDGAVRHLEQRVDGIRRRVQALRQEEIIEEIEVILLNAAQLDDTGGPVKADEAP